MLPSLCRISVPLHSLVYTIEELEDRQKHGQTDGRTEERTEMIKQEHELPQTDHSAAFLSTNKPIYRLISLMTYINNGYINLAQSLPAYSASKSIWKFMFS